MQKLIKAKFPVHLIGWLIFFIAPIMLSPRGFTDFLQSNALWPVLLRNFIMMGFFYVNLYFLTPVILKRHGIAAFLLCIVGAVVLITALSLTFQPPPPHEFGPPQGPPRRPMPFFGGPFLTTFLVTIMIASVSSSIAFWNDWNKARELEQERALQKVASELAILKLQVSPHFLFNTLNNIRWLIRSRSERAEEAVIKLSQLLRYILYQTNDEKVSLQKEIENLDDLISLQKMRLVDETVVEFVVKGNVSGKTITPLLFVPLVENFFKHGGGIGRIELELTDSRLTFKTENKIREKSSEPDSGIGVANVVRRLQLHYPNKHLFNVSQDNDVYKLHLEILL